MWSWLRTLVGALLWSAIWWGLGWALSSASLGWALAFWSLLLGPFLIGPLLWAYLRLRGDVTPVKLTEQRAVLDAYFRCILEKPGRAAPELWLRRGGSGAADVAWLWYESNQLYPFRSRQVVIVTTAWLLQPEERKARDFVRIWEEISSLSPARRHLRRWQMRLWWGALSPLGTLLLMLGLVVENVGFSDLPGAAFWVRPWTRGAQRLWFGRASQRKSATQDDSPGPQRRSLAFRAPSVWNSLLFGVWFEVPRRELHPLLAAEG